MNNCYVQEDSNEMICTLSLYIVQEDNNELLCSRG